MRNTDISKYTDETESQNAPNGKAIAKNILTVFRKIITTTLLVFLFTGIVVVISLIFYIAQIASEPFSLDLKNAKSNQASVIYYQDENGQLQEYQTLSTSKSTAWKDYNEIPKAMKDAIIAIEDKRFEDHHGVDWIRTTSAVLNLVTGRDEYGGSTITQQLVKNITENDEVSLTRKVREISRALELEKQYTKEEIIEAYLNIVNFGSGCRGVQAAANLYFDKDISECTVAECAAIAGITQNPAAYSPLAYPEKNKERREVVIEAMYDQGKITKAEYQKAMKESATMTFVGYSEDDDDSYDEEMQSWYTDAVFKEVSAALAEKYKITLVEAERRLYQEGMKIVAAIDPKAQEIAQRKVLEWETPDDKKLECAYVMMGFDGRILATVGSRKEKEGLLWWDRADEAYLQPGSTIKPIAVYTPAIEEGLINFSSLIPDQPVSDWMYDENGMSISGPKNWYEGYRGNITTMTALEISSNATVVNLIKMLGQNKSYDFLTQKLNFQHLDEEEDSKNLGALTMGGVHGGVTVREMTASYAMYCNGGKYYKPYTYYYVMDQDNNILLDNRDSIIPSQVISPETATIMNRLLHQVVSGHEGLGYRAAVEGWDIIGKTGTTDDSFDNWFVGASPYCVAGVWQGHDVRRAINVNEQGKSHYLWADIMSEYLSTKDYKEFELSENVQELDFCTETGLLATSNCPNTEKGYYTENNMPDYCTASHSVISTPKPPDENSKRPDEIGTGSGPSNESSDEPSSEPTSEPSSESSDNNSGGASESGSSTEPSGDGSEDVSDGSQGNDSSGTNPSQDQSQQNNSDNSETQQGEPPV